MTISLDSVRQISKKFKEAENKTTGKSNSNLFMKFVPNKANRIRIVGELKAINNAWINGTKFVIPNDYVEKVEALGHDVRQNVVCNIIDRADEKLRFKIMEKGPSVFRPIITRFEEVKDENGDQIHPGGPASGDWFIKPVVKGPKPRDTSYEVQWVDKTPLTKEEKQLIARAKDPEKYKDLPLGEKGLIDLEIMYNEEKAIKRLNAYLESEGEEVSEGGDDSSVEEDLFDDNADSSDSSDSSDSPDDEILDDEDMF